jgi:hypothetical protein
VICAWGITENGERALVSVRLGMRETKEDWLELEAVRSSVCGVEAGGWCSVGDSVSEVDLEGS